MTNEQLVARFKELEHFVIDVWGWEELHRIGYKLNDLWLIQEPGYKEGIDYGRGLEVELETHLSVRYILAIEQIEKVVVEVGPSELAAAQFERLHTSVVRLLEEDAQFYLAYNAAPQPDVDALSLADDPTGALTQDRIQQQIDSEKAAWRCVTKDVTFYLSKVADMLLRRGFSTSLAPSDHGSLQRIKWTCTTQAYIHIAKELVGKGYLELPGMNAKDGDGNVTEFLRRLSQAFLVTGRDGKELDTAELQRRWNGRNLSGAKAARLDFPEAKEL